MPVTSKPYLEIDSVDRADLVKVLASLGVERIAVYSEHWETLFAYPTEDEGRAMQSLAVSVSGLLDDDDPWMLLQKEDRSFLLVRSEGKHVAIEGILSPENLDLVVLLSRMLTEE